MADLSASEVRWEGGLALPEESWVDGVTDIVSSVELMPTSLLSRRPLLGKHLHVLFEDIFIVPDADVWEET